MAARCGELPDSVMTVPGLEYVGEKSAEWEALCVRAAGWIGQGPEASRIDPYDEELAPHGDCDKGSNMTDIVNCGAPNVGALVLLSGLDSTAALHWAMSQYKDVRAVSFDYGQAHAKQELAASKQIARRLGVHWLQCKTFVGGVHNRAPRSGSADGVSFANVPARNLLLLTTAAGLAATMWPSGLAALVIGANADDAKLFPDCKAPFFSSADRALNLALEGVCRVAVITPWQYLTKSQIVSWCASKPAALRDARQSVSCYAGTRCGNCDACKLRATAFASNEVIDR
jgi:7-cyano-7-deazaguanine synthase